MLFPDTERADATVKIDGEPVVSLQLIKLFAHFQRTEYSSWCSRSVCEHQILETGQGCYETEVLQDDPDSQSASIIWPIDIPGMPAYRNQSFVRALKTRQHPDKSCLPGTVLTNQPQDFTCVHVQAHVIYR